MTGSISSKTLRDFIFLDKDRMYSLYSQLFEGVVESMVRSVSSGIEEEKKDRKLEETIIDASVKVQNVVLFDHIYNTLEEKLKPYIHAVDEATKEEDIKPGAFIKVTGYTAIENFEHLMYFMSNYNDIGTAFSTISLLKDLEGKKPISKNAIEQYAKDNHLYLDKKYIESMLKVIDELHGNTMEIAIQSDNPSLDIGFRAFLNKDYLRVTPSSIRSLYGYKPCMKWTLVGEVTSLSFVETSNVEKAESIFSGMFSTMAEVDKSFASMRVEPKEGADKENSKTVRIAPIAVYIEHNLSVDGEQSIGDGKNGTHEI